MMIWFPKTLTTLTVFLSGPAVSILGRMIFHSTEQSVFDKRGSIHGPHSVMPVEHPGDERTPASPREAPSTPAVAELRTAALVNRYRLEKRT